MLPCQNFSFNIEKLRQTFGLPRFLGEPNFVLKVFWKLQVNNVTISTLTTILWSDVIRCFLKKNNKNNKDEKIKAIKSFPSKHSSWWRRLSSSSSRRLDQDEYVRLSLMSSEDVFKTSWSRPIYSSWLYVFKTSSRRFQDVFKTSCKNVFKTSSRRLAKISSRRFQDVSSS